MRFINFPVAHENEVMIPTSRLTQTHAFPKYIADEAKADAMFLRRVQKRAKAADDAEYPSYGVTGPNSSGGGKISPSSTMSDRKLAQSAQMFHYQQQRQQMMAQEKCVPNSATFSLDARLFVTEIFSTQKQTIQMIPTMKHRRAAITPFTNVPVWLR